MIVYNPVTAGIALCGYVIESSVGELVIASAREQPGGEDAIYARMFDVNKRDTQELGDEISDWAVSVGVTTAESVKFVNWMFQAVHREMMEKGAIPVITGIQRLT